MARYQGSANHGDEIRGSLLTFEAGLIEQQEQIGLRQRWLAARRGRIESHAQSEWSSAEARLNAYKVRWNSTQARINQGIVFWAARRCEKRGVAQRA